MTARQSSLAARPPVSMTLVVPVCLALLVLAMVTGVAWGSVRLTPGVVLGVVWDRLTDRPPVGSSAIADDAVVFRIRLPRVLLAAVVGAALSTCGVVVQALVRNALADPYLLGVSSGASVGATSVLLFGSFSGLGVWSLAGGGMAGAAVATALVFLVSQRRGQLSPLQLILCGVALAALFSAISSFMIFRGDPRASQTVLYWLLGSFGSANWTQLPLPALVLVGSTVVLMALARSLNALALGPEVAASVGVDVRRLRGLLFVLTCLIAGIAVSVSGVIGFIGLVVPHIVRLAVGSDHRRVLPVAVLFGAAFAVIGDLLARSLVAPQEMPMGVVTAFLGAPVLIWLVRRRPAMFGGGL